MVVIETKRYNVTRHYLNWGTHYDVVVYLHGAFFFDAVSTVIIMHVAKKVNKQVQVKIRNFKFK